MAVMETGTTYEQRKNDGKHFMSAKNVMIKFTQKNLIFKNI